ncbi:hypothetical protein A7K94_0205230 [Modestobacter sp. VKM Ac-2676]|nr:hypothetical protein A7K94_0205230 [Modestobacter sp. VKM Ac-2676]
MVQSWTVSEQLRWVAARRPDAVAIVDQAGEETFGTFSRRVQALAGHLAPLAGGRVGLYLANRREWAEAFFACQLAGISVVPVNDRYQERELRHLVADAGIAWWSPTRRPTAGTPSRACGATSTRCWWASRTSAPCPRPARRGRGPTTSPRCSTPPAPPRWPRACGSRRPTRPSGPSSGRRPCSP